MEVEYTFLQSWAAVALACIATLIWRLMGVVFYNKISENGLLIKWVNSIAYSMVSAVMMMILIYPTGALATTLTEHRILGLIIGLSVMLIFKNLVSAILISLISFGVIVTYF